MRLATLVLALLVTGLRAGDGVPGARLPTFHPGNVGIEVPGRGLALVEVVLEDTPTRATVTPELERRVGPGRSFVPVVLTGWEDPRGRGLLLRSVPAWYLYREGRLVETGMRAMKRFRDAPIEGADSRFAVDPGRGSLPPGL